MGTHYVALTEAPPWRNMMAFDATIAAEVPARLQVSAGLPTRAHEAESQLQIAPALG